MAAMRDGFLCVVGSPHHIAKSLPDYREAFCLRGRERFELEPRWMQRIGKISRQDKTCKNCRLLGLFFYNILHIMFWT